MYKLTRPWLTTDISKEEPKAVALMADSSLGTWLEGIKECNHRA